MRIVCSLWFAGKCVSMRLRKLIVCNVCLTDVFAGREIKPANDVALHAYFYGVVLSHVVHIPAYSRSCNALACFGKLVLLLENLAYFKL